MSIKPRNFLEATKLLASYDLTILDRVFPNGVVCLDLEFTGLSPLAEEIIEMAGVKYHQGKTETFSTLVRPTISIPEKSIAIHGIQNKDTQDAPTIEEALPLFWKFIDALPILAHNAQVDLGFMAFASHRIQFQMHASSVFCTLKMTRKYLDAPSYALDALIMHYNIPIPNRHQALDDSIATLILTSLALSKGIKGNSNITLLLKSSLLYNLKDYFRKLQNPDENFKLPPTMHGLKDIIRDQKKIEILYDAGSYKGELRPIRPMAIIPMPKGLILYALCLHSNQSKSFKVKKIKQVKLD